MENKMTTKIFPSFTKALDAETGIVEAYVSVFGIRDQDNPPDIIQLGAFAKTIQERGPQGAKKIRVLYQHHWSDVIGLPLTLVEHGRDQLPAGLVAKYPDATGGLFARTQFVMDVQLGRETWALYKAGAMDEWSIGFDALQFEFLQEDEDQTVRILKELKLWEYSPVTWGMNQATITTDVKQDEMLRPGSGEPGTSVNVPDGHSARAKSREIALTRARMQLKLLELGSGVRLTGDEEDD